MMSAQYCCNAYSSGFLSLPLWPLMPDAFVDQVCERLSGALAEARGHGATPVVAEYDEAAP